MLHFFKDLFLHGEGGDGAGAATGAAPGGAEAAGVTAPDAGEREGRKLTREERKAERRARLEEKLAAERAQATPQQPAQDTQQTQAPKMYSEEELNQKIQTAVTGRVKNLKDSSAENTSLKAENERLSKLLAQLAKSQYEIEPGADGKLNIDAIEQAATRSRADEYAMQNGVSTEFAEERIRMEDQLAEQKRQLEAYQMQEEARKQDAAAYALVQKHLQEAEEFRKKVPNFDLKAEIEATPLFKHLIVNCGVGVENAYWAAHHEDLLAVGQQAAAQQATQALASRIRAGQTMPAEGGLGRTPAASPQRIADPRQWTKEMRKDIRKRVQNGENIYL